MGDNASRYDSPEMRALIDDMAAECIAVVQALGGTSHFHPWSTLTTSAAGRFHGPNMPARWLSISRAAGTTEIDELTGFIVHEGERLKVPVPNCKAVYRLVKGLELAAQRRVAKAR